ncbi:hypothetical protein [Clavibacter tessellarius]|uniref:hypothetical protein n=1 Tax=Clavibacter tessellarius TaxID=31965 RepID=UPI00324905B3
MKTVESDVVALDADTSGWRWTLTWLERKPVVETRRRHRDPLRPDRGRRHHHHPRREHRRPVRRLTR